VGEQSELRADTVALAIGATRANLDFPEHASDP
jgi:hypothetical protein